LGYKTVAVDVSQLQPEELEQLLAMAPKYFDPEQ
jgi:hypothetical protein